jgi:hypothetical protein
MAPNTDSPSFLNLAVLKHEFDEFAARQNLYLMPQDFVINVAECQQIHDYDRGFADFSRFIPFSVNRLCAANEPAVLYRNKTYESPESQWRPYLATLDAEKWTQKFPEVSGLGHFTTYRHDGPSNTTSSYIVRTVDGIIRRLFSYPHSLRDKS